MYDQPRFHQQVGMQQHIQQADHSAETFTGLWDGTNLHCMSGSHLLATRVCDAAGQRRTRHYEYCCRDCQQGDMCNCSYLKHRRESKEKDSTTAANSGQWCQPNSQRTSGLPYSDQKDAKSHQFVLQKHQKGALSAFKLAMDPVQGNSSLRQQYNTANHGVQLFANVGAGIDVHDDFVMHLYASSVSHAAGQCRPCHYFHTRRGCQDGTKCEFCHHTHKRKRKKAIATSDSSVVHCQQPNAMSLSPLAFTHGELQYKPTTFTSMIDQIEEKIPSCRNRPTQCEQCHTLGVVLSSCLGCSGYFCQGCMANSDEGCLVCQMTLRFLGIDM